MARSLAERLRAHEQQKARLAEREAKLKTAEGKARTRRLIEVGGLVDKAGLLDLDSSTLYGALLSLRDGTGDKAQLGKSEAARRPNLRPRGPPARRRPRTDRAHPPHHLEQGQAAPLRAAGFSFNKVLQHWEGLARFAEAEALAKEHGGAARRVTSPAVSVSAPAPARASAVA